MRYIAFFLVLFFCSLPTASKAEQITITADVWCPYNCDPKAEHPGYMVEIAQRAFARHGITVQYVVQPWSRAIKETREGKYTAIVGSPVSNAPDFVFPDTMQGHGQSVFFIKKGGTWRYTGIDSLKTVSLGVIADYSYSEGVDAYIQLHKNDPKRVEITTGEHALDVRQRHAGDKERGKHFFLPQKKKRENQD